MKVVKVLLFVFSVIFVSKGGYSEVGNFNMNYQYIPSELIVTVSDSASFLDEDSLFSNSNINIVKSFKSSNSYLIRFDKSLNEEALKREAEKILGTNGVKNVEVNVVYHLYGVAPNDTDFSMQYGLDNDGQSGGTVDADIDAVEAWEIHTGSKDVLVGVLDTGIDYNHPDLFENYWSNPGETGLDQNGQDKRSNGIDDDNNGYVDDWRGWDFINNDNDPLDDNNHGTHCAGIIGARSNNGIGISGVNWNVSMVGLKVFDSEGLTTTDAIVGAIEYATSIGVDLTSNSWGGGAYSQLIYDAIKKAEENGILFVAAAGNSSQNTDEEIIYPSGYEIDNIISVASTDHNDNISDFSNYGIRTVDVAAPGTDIYSTVINDDYSMMSGTSMAAPHVAGIAALIMGAYPGISYKEVKARILYNTDMKESLFDKVWTGGRVNAYLSLEKKDYIAPSKPEDLRITKAGISTLEVSYLRAGDDDKEGAAIGYEVRVSESPIKSLKEWEEASTVSVHFSEDRDDPNRIKANVLGLDYNLKGYVAVRAFDNVGQWGATSESLEFQLRHAEIIYTNSGNNLDGVITEGTWGIETLDGNSLFSDSPSGLYESDIDSSLTFDAILVNSAAAILEFRTSYDLEAEYDFGYLEISIDQGENFKKVATFNGSSSYKRVSYNLEKYLKDVSTIQLRFRIETDGSLNRDGWKIDDVTIFSD